MKKFVNATLAISMLMAACSSKTSQPTASETPGGASTAPSSQEASNQKKALVRFVQAVPDRQKTDLWFGDMKVFTNVSYKDVTPYTEVPAERHDFKLQISGVNQTTAPATNSEGLSAGGHYTIVAEKKDDHGEALTLDPIKDDLTPPAAGKAKVRVINAARGLGKVDVYYPNGKIVTGVGPDSSSSYAEVQPSQGTVEIRRADKKVDVLRIPNMSLQPDKLYTLLIVGGAGRPYEAIPITDTLSVPTGD